MAPSLPPSARALRALLGPSPVRRANPDGLRGFFLWTQAPHPEQPWVLRGEYADEDLALDEAIGLEPRPEPGTVLRLDQGRRLRWLGLVDPEGQVTAVGPVPAQFRYIASDWVGLWEGDRASAAWMLHSGTETSMSLGGTSVTGPTGSLATTADPLQIGSDGITGRVLEVLVYSAVPSDLTQGLLNDYLLETYGVALGG